MNSVESPAESLVGSGGAGDKLAVTDTISVDTSGSLVDTPPHQHDSGSNQSGSDSGLGYSNNASDNSFNPKAAKNLLGIPTVSAPSALLLSQDNKTSNNASANYPQNRITTSNTHHLSSCKQHNNSESACSTYIGTNNNNKKPVLVEGKAKTLPGFSSQANKSSSSCESSSLLPDINDSTSKTGILAHQQKKHERTFPRECSNNLHLKQHPNELISPSLPSSLSPTKPCEAAPVLKSLLKRPTSLKSRDKLPKHNRKVCFNQTVIVFCEEVVTSSSPPLADNAVNVSTDQFESQPLPLPTQIDEYQDYHLTPPHHQYCDAKNSINPLVNIGTDRALGESGNNLDDNRLFSLLEDESLLESFHSQHGECDLSDDDFTGNSLNYLSIDAISDYDSDSESSSIVDRKEQNGLDQTNLLKSTTSQKIGNSHQSKKTCENETRISNKENKTALFVRAGPLPIVESRHQPAKIATQKLMPARMKVTPVDQSLAQNSNLQRESELNLNLSSKTAGTDELHAPLNQKSSTYATYNNLERSFESSTALTNSSILPDEQHHPNFQNLRDSSDIYGSNTLQNTKLVDQVQRTVDYRPSIPSQQPDSFLPNTKATQAPGCCQICQLIESHKSSPYSGTVNVGNRSQPTSREDTTSGVASVLSQDGNINQTNNFYNSLPLPNRPNVLSQSCVSCRELSMKQATVLSNGVNISGTQQVTPVACQVVYLVDQKGNRIRALSVVKSPQNGAMSSTQACRQFYVPTSTVLLPGSTNSRFIKIDGAHAGQTGALVTNDVTSHHLSQLPGNVQQLQNQENKLVGSRKQMVYYIRQPLDPQHMSQPANFGEHATRSFPDPHEIRRLDGVKGPTSVSNLIKRETDKATCSSNFSTTPGFFSETPEMIADDTEDPTFGFSQRPSVKVVANFIKPPQEFAAPQSTIQEGFRGSASILSSEGSKQNFTGGRSPFILYSQTLDRVGQHHQNVMKEIIPSTSSMSNINGTLSTPPTQTQFSNDAGPTKVDNEHKLSLANKVQQSNIVVCQPRLIRGKQLHDDVPHNYPITGSIEAQKTNKILYSLNI